MGLDEVWWLVSPGNPLKSRAGMAPLKARLRSAGKQARRAPIVPTAIEQQLGTRYTVDTLRALVRRYPKRRFVWLMGADNLAQFPPVEGLARNRPDNADCGLIARPGYDAPAMTSPAMAWLRRYRVPAASFSETGAMERTGPWCYCVSIRITVRPRPFAVHMPGGPKLCSGRIGMTANTIRRCATG